MKKAIFFAFLLLGALVGGVAAEGQSRNFENSIEGTLQLRDDRWVFVADQVYLITTDSRLENYDGKSLSLRELVAGRLSRLISHTRERGGTKLMVDHLIMEPPS